MKLNEYHLLNPVYIAIITSQIFYHGRFMTLKIASLLQTFYHGRFMTPKIAWLLSLCLLLKDVQLLLRTSTTFELFYTQTMNAYFVSS